MTRHPNFREVCLNQHKYPISIFDSFVKTGNIKFSLTLEKEQWDSFTQICSSISSFVGVFPERSTDFQKLIIPLIKVISNKTDNVRKQAAVTLAKLSQNEENAAVMRANHGTEVLMSL